MSEGTTRPNGGSMNMQEDVSKEEIKMLSNAAGYNFTIDAMETIFTNERVKSDVDNNASNSEGNNTTSNTNKTSDFVIAGKSLVVRFVPMIKEIAKGSVKKLRSKEMNKANRKEALNKEENSHEEK